MPVVLSACIGMFFLSISVGGESSGQLGEGLGRTGGWVGDSQGNRLLLVWIFAVGYGFQ